MKKIQACGMGCQKCGKLYENAEAAAKDLGIEYTIEKVNDMAEIVAMGIMATPALVVDGVLKASGRVPSVESIREFLK